MKKFITAITTATLLSACGGTDNNTDATEEDQKNLDGSSSGISKAAYAVVDSLLRSKSPTSSASDTQSEQQTSTYSFQMQNVQQVVDSEGYYDDSEDVCQTSGTYKTSVPYSELEKLDEGRASYPFEFRVKANQCKSVLESGGPGDLSMEWSYDGELSLTYSSYTHFEYSGQWVSEFSEGGIASQFEIEGAGRCVDIYESDEYLYYVDTVCSQNEIALQSDAGNEMNVEIKSQPTQLEGDKKSGLSFNVDLVFNDDIPLSLDVDGVKLGTCEENQFLESGKISIQATIDGTEKTIQLDAVSCTEMTMTVDGVATTINP